MYEIKTMNKIAQQGLDILAENGLVLNVDSANPDGLLIRSAKLHDETFGDRLLAIARAGAGVDNVPVSRCTEEGIVVFNSAGANAEAVKELTLCGLLLASRDVIGGIEWAKSLTGEADFSAAVEKGKNNFVGPELMGKTLGVVGLGAIGYRVANAAVALGMKVWGYDPYLSVDAAWRLRSEIKHAPDLETLYRECDYITLHMAATNETKGLVNAAAIAKMKPGVRIVNFARGALVNEGDILSALSVGKLACYVTDFGSAKLAAAPGVVVLPHLGASTPESEEKSAVIAAQELADYLLNGNLKNAVNMPNVSLDRSGVCRLSIIHKNVPKVLNSFLDLIGKKNINVENMVNKSKGEIGYTIIDVSEHVGDDVVSQIQNMDVVLRVREI
ncbi:MAG: phosphoglycerate dehydrogenase [Oscillospiraceae bacterium]|nr:phosphoglycerate dehydrogenase [Oscillospiraceae bacterium]